MNMEDFDFYLGEIINESQLALDAIGELNFSMSNLNRLSRQNHRYHEYHREVFNSIDVFLQHACTISHMLWPEISKKGKNEKESDDKDICCHSENRITRNIKKRLGLDGSQLLMDRTLRNHFEEHMERFELTSIESVGKFSLNGFPVFVAYSLCDRKICHYDPISRNFHFNGKAYNIQEAASVIFKLLSYACEERQKRKTAPRTEFVPIGQSLQANSLA